VKERFISPFLRFLATPFLRERACYSSSGLHFISGVIICPQVIFATSFSPSVFESEIAVPFFSSLLLPPPRSGSFPLVSHASLHCPTCHDLARPPRTQSDRTDPSLSRTRTTLPSLFFEPVPFFPICSTYTFPPLNGPSPKDTRIHHEHGLHPLPPHECISPSLLHCAPDYQEPFLFPLPSPDTGLHKDTCSRAL